MINVLRNKIRELESNIHNNKMAIKQHEFVLGLTDEQKADFVKYIQAEECISHITYEVRNLESRFCAALPKIDSKELIIQAMKLLEQDGLTEEEITRVFKKLDKVAILRSRDEYEHKPWFSERETDIQIIKSFVKEIYESDPDFVDRNMSQIVSLDKEDKEVDVKEQDVPDDSDDPEL